MRQNRLSDEETEQVRFFIQKHLHNIKTINCTLSLLKAITHNTIAGRIAPQILSLLSIIKRHKNTYNSAELKNSYNEIKYDSVTRGNLGAEGWMFMSW